ncbi:hypothetical protein ACQPUL_05535 [Clostridium butyricum]|uniref:hypothetical protein n=1 Tax=Clostridium butyricum TaxID=1492 RepID=UPI003D357D0B
MKLTTNYGLNKPDYTDEIDIQKINENFQKIDNSLSPYASASGTNAYTITIPGITSYIDGLKVTVKIGATSTGASTLNINGLGAKTILDNLGNAIINGGLKAGIPYNLCFNGTNFIVLGKGGGGNLIPKYLLAGYYGEGDNGRVDGAMVNRGAPTSNLNCGGVVNLQEGYYSGGQITANSLASQTGGATADDTKVLNGYTYWRDGALRTGNASLQSLGGVPATTLLDGATGSNSNYVLSNNPSELLGKLLLFITYSTSGSLLTRGWIYYNSTSTGQSTFRNFTTGGTINYYINTTTNQVTFTPSGDSWSTRRHTIIAVAVDGF